MSERHQQISQLFNEARALEPDRREVYLRAACDDDRGLFDEVMRLLEHDDASFPALDAAASAEPRTLALETLAEAGSDAPALPPVDIEGYCSLKLIGQGGMGAVYEAEQQMPRRTVALKVIRPGFLSSTLMKRFAHETHVLGQLEHEGIARIYEAGTASTDHGDLPWFAMEFIQGRDLLDHVASKKADRRERLELFVSICDAVEHAHQRGIIHRDLKPANILVTDSGQPKILDFGVARLTDRDMQAVTIQTVAGEIVGTLPYMSPEQAAGHVEEVDRRSDVYSLGVILYQLVSGQRPYDLKNTNLADAVRVIREVEPTRVGKLDSAVRGDIETIVHTALEKDRERRYQSAAGLAADIRRHFRHEPIVARPTSALYQLRKFTRRNKAIVTGVGVAMAAMILGTVFSLNFAFDAQEEKKRAELEAESSRRFVDFIINTLTQMDPGRTLGEEPTLRSALDAVATNLETQLAEDPLIRARLHVFLGNMYRSLAHTEQSVDHLEKAVSIFRERKVESLDAAEARWAWGWLLFKFGRFDEAEALVAEAQDILARIDMVDSPSFATGLNTQAEISLERGNLEAAARQVAEALAMRRKLFEGDNEDTAISLLISAGVELKSDRLDEASRYFEECLEMRRRLHGDRHPLVAETLQNMSSVSYRRDDFETAEKLMREATEIKAATLPKGHPALASGLHNLAVLNYRKGDFEQALVDLGKAAELYRRAYPGGTPRLAASLMLQARVLARLDRKQEVEPAILEAIKVLRNAHEGGHRDLALALSLLGQFRESQERHEDAHAAFKEALEMYTRISGADHPETIDMRTRTEQAASVLEKQSQLPRSP